MTCSTLLLPPSRVESGEMNGQQKYACPQAPGPGRPERRGLRQKPSFCRSPRLSGRPGPGACGHAYFCWPFISPDSTLLGGSKRVEHVIHKTRLMLAPVQALVLALLVTSATVRGA